MLLERAVRMITGPRYTKVALTIQRPGRGKPFDLAIERDEIHIQTVKGWRALPDGKWDYFVDPQARIAYIRLSQFTADTPEEIRQALKTAREGGAEAVILDLRFNPGGLLNAAVDVADEFLRRGLIVRTEGRNVQETPKEATALGEYQQGRLAVLVNRISASAAEIVAGALKDWRRAEIVGERSYGKGSVQRLIPLKSKKAKLKLTTAYYYLPSGRLLHRTNGAKDWGVDPDAPVPVTVRQLNRWAEIRQETDLLKTVDPSRLSSLLKQQLGQDVQLQTAILLLKLQALVLPPGGQENVGQASTSGTAASRVRS
jgi:carboxyl-terminal processing protease